MGNQERKILSFNLGEETYAIEISQVERIIQYKEVRKAEGWLPFMKEVITYENKELPILDLCDKYEIEREEEKQQFEDKVIVCKWKENNFGIRVSKVKDVISLEEEFVKPIPKLLGYIEEEGLRYICNIEDTIMFLLDSNYILSEEEAQRVFQEE